LCPQRCAGEEDACNHRAGDPAPPPASPRPPPPGLRGEGSWLSVDFHGCEPAAQSDSLT
jgi:hypothetical protein